MWRSVETEAFVSNWHIDAICEHLEAVSFGEIKRLIINMPPRHMKSLGVSVFWPAWEWMLRPQTKYLYASYAQTLSIRDSVKCRRVVSSPFYMRNIIRKFPGFELTGDQNTKIRFDNTQGGYRLATSVDGALTGEGGDIIVVDDPHNVVQGESATYRESVLRWWDEAMSTRLNNPQTGAYVIIMQRVHENDLTGHILEKEYGNWNHLCLPARYERETRSKTILNFTDPRTEEGEPLWPERYGDKELKELEKSMSPYAAAGQLQQRPAPREGGMFNVDKFNLINDFDSTRVVESVRYWDKAGTLDGGCLSAGVLIHKMKNNRFVVADCTMGHWDALRRESIIRSTAEIDGKSVKVWCEQEPGSGGKESAENTIRNLIGFVVQADKVTGSKETRAEPWSSQVNGGNVDLMPGSWRSEFIAQHQMFPNGKYKDIVDASAGAFNKLAPKKPGGVWGR